ncbi:hypothetical protein V2A60_002435 [Cordyceps javanica]
MTFELRMLFAEHVTLLSRWWKLSRIHLERPLCSEVDYHLNAYIQRSPSSTVVTTSVPPGQGPRDGLDSIQRSPGTSTEIAEQVHGQTEDASEPWSSQGNNHEPDIPAELPRHTRRHGSASQNDSASIDADGKTAGLGDGQLQQQRRWFRDNTAPSRRRYSHLSKMDIFAFPTEIRLRIYSELLVCRGTIECPVKLWDDSSARLCPEGIKLYPALLCTSRQVYNEAISLLYADNNFQFPGLDTASTRCNRSIAAFVQQIGARASLIRHICVEFPATPLADERRHDHGLQNERFHDLDLLRDACPNIATLELLLPLERAEIVLHSSIFTELLDLIHARLKAFRSLQEVKVDIEVLTEDSDDESNNGVEDRENDEREGTCNNGCKTDREPLRQLYRRGWAVNITEVPTIEFDHEDDNNDMIEWHRREQQREEEEWDSYYRQRQVESYRMDYADDGGPA